MPGAPDTPETSDPHPRLQELERALQDCRQQQALYFSQAPVPSLLLDTLGTIQNANPAAHTLFGRSREALVRHRLATFLTPTTTRSLTQLLSGTASNGIQQGELQVVGVDGRTVDVLVAVSAVLIQGGVPGYQLALTDITAYKAAHRSLLDQAAVSDEQALIHDTHARFLNQELTQVTLSFVRELHLPLGRAHAFLAVARQAMRSPTEEVERALTHVDRSLQEVVALMTSVSGYVQVRVNRTLTQSVKLEPLLRSALAKLGPIMTGRDVRITHQPLPTVTGDSQSLRLILEELLGNAVKYTRTREVAHIHLSVQENDREYVFKMEDNGVGFTMRQKDKLFQLFGRLHSSKEFEGTGVGLLSVRWAVERAGGRVWAEGKVDQGATFFFAWPKVVPQQRRN